MTTPARPDVECDQQHPSIFVPDIRAAVGFYTEKLGFNTGFLSGDPPTMAGINLGKMQIFLEKGAPHPAGCSLYFIVGNADQLYEFQRASGVEVVVAPGDREYGLRDYTVRDLHGYRLTFGHRTFTADGPPIEIERVDVPVRLEKRLAAVLRDLAEFKHMSLSSCLEETLCHTFEPLGEGIASPHTQTDIRHIQQLKRKHGIDYDSHGSYRFVER